MKWTPPETVVRSAITRNFDKISPETWGYLFDYEKENGLAECRVPAPWGIRRAWYSVSAVKKWVINRGYYSPDDFDSNGWPIPTRRSIPRGLKVTTHVLA